MPSSVRKIWDKTPPPRDDRGGAEGGTLLPPSHSSTAVSPSPDHPRHLAAEQPAMKQSQKAAKAAVEMRGGGTATRKRKLPMTHEAAKEATSCNKAAVAAVSPAASIEQRVIFVYSMGETVFSHKVYKPNGTTIIFLVFNCYFWKDVFSCKLV